MTLLERIKVLREANGNISINKLEKEAGLTRGSMAKWDDHPPSADKVRKVAQYFGVPTSSLLDPPYFDLQLFAEEQKKPALPKEDELNASLVDRLIQLTPEELEKVDAFVQGLLASR